MYRVGRLLGLWAASTILSKIHQTAHTLSYIFKKVPHSSMIHCTSWSLLRICVQSSLLPMWCIFNSMSSSMLSCAINSSGSTSISSLSSAPRPSPIGPNVPPTSYTCLGGFPNHCVLASNVIAVHRRAKYHLQLRVALTFAFHFRSSNTGSTLKPKSSLPLMTVTY